MAVEIAARFDKRHRRQVATRCGATHQVVVKVGGVLQRHLPHRRGGHDRCRVLEKVADVAVLIVRGDEIVVGISKIRVKLVAEIGK